MSSRNRTTVEMKDLFFEMNDISPSITIPWRPNYLMESRSDVHPSGRDKEWVVIRRNPCLPNPPLSESPQYFLNLLLSETSFSIFGENAVMADHAVCRRLPWVEREEPHDVPFVPAQEGTCSDRFRVLEHVSIRFFPICLLVFPYVGFSLDKLSIALVE